MDRDNITRIGARASRVEGLVPSNGGAIPSLRFGLRAGQKALATECTKGRCKPRVVRSMFGASLTYATRGKALPDSMKMPTFQPYWGKPAVRDDRGTVETAASFEARFRATVLPDKRKHGGNSEAPATERVGNR
jgi:hypothetical protein